MRGVLVAAALVLLIATACNPFKSKAQATPSGSPTPSTVAQASGPLDPQVDMPPGFPSDVPIFPGARLTAGAGFTSNGVESWGMEWETLAPASQAYQFYASKFASGDWTIKFTSTTNTAFAGTFNRKSNPNVKGDLGVDSSSGVTKISLFLTAPQH